MRRMGMLPVWVVAMALISTACSTQEKTKPRSSEQSGRRPGAVGTGGAGANVKSDGDLVRDVAIKNMAVIELSRLALEKSANPQIKALAQEIIDDADAIGNKLKGVVSGPSIEWPAHLDDKYQKIADELANKQGADFDREYVTAMVEGHQDLAAKLESRLDVQSLTDWKTAAAARTQRNALPDADTVMSDVSVRPDKSDNEITMKINQWAADTYPVAQKHLDAARSLAKATKRSSSNRHQPSESLDRVAQSQGELLDSRGRGKYLSGGTPTLYS